MLESQMLESQTFARISRVLILIIGSLLILGIQIILVTGSMFRWFIIIQFIVGTDMTVDVMQSATFELNKSNALHSAQTNLAMANEAKRACEFANGNSVEGSVGLAFERPLMQPVGSFILIRGNIL